MKNILFIIILLLLSFIGAFVGKKMLHGLNPQQQKQVLATNAHQVISSTPEPTQVDDFIIPKHIRIPSIGVDTEIESVGMDAQGRMDVPKNVNNTAWYSPGFKPGQNGSAVLAGHYDKQDGSPAVFWNIPKLQRGDVIEITDQKGKSISFTVTKKEKYPYDQFPLEEVFGKNEKPMLNLITCQGNWDAKTKNYSDRLVVYSQGE